MDTYADVIHLLRLGEPFAAGYAELPGAAPIERFSRAYRRWFETCPLTPYDGGALYPHGKRTAPPDACLAPSYSFTWAWNATAYEAKLACATPKEAEALSATKQAFEALALPAQYLATPHTVGGAGYTHSIPAYERVIAEGLDAHAARIAKGLTRTEGSPEGAFYRGLDDLLMGVRAWHGRLVAEVSAASPTLAQGAERERLLAALAQVPFRPARSFYEALLAYALTYEIDGCDNPGRFDQVLWPYYRDDASITRGEALALIHSFFETVAANGGWSLALGGSLPDGEPAYQELTEVCLEAVRGLHRPSLELRVRDDMPDRIWAAALETLGTGCGQPAFYNESGYLHALRDPRLGVSEADLAKWNGGGCTETMIHGCSNVGSLDAGFNLALILEGTLERMLDTDALSFDTLLDVYKTDVHATLDDVLERLNAYHAARATLLPQPVRSLLVDDCIDRGLDFNAGGARYAWSVVNIAGLSNVADALEAVREIVCEHGELSPRALLAALRQDFVGDEPLRQRLLRCAKFGNDDPRVDALAADLAGFVYRAISAHPAACAGTARGAFLPSHIMFETFGWAGKPVGATPDGRHAGDPLGDSVGPVQGRDRIGPTAMLRSVTRLPLAMAAGTPVLNLRLTRQVFDAPEGRERVRDLITTYLEMGGLQLQVSVLDREQLLDALEHPERHGDLIVRIGGYSTYFNWLSDDLKHEVIRRTEYAV